MSGETLTPPEAARDATQDHDGGKAMTGAGTHTPQHTPPEPVRHADHDPALICRPAFGNGLCEPLSPELSAKIRDSLEAVSRGETVDREDYSQYADEPPDAPAVPAGRDRAGGAS